MLSGHQLFGLLSSVFTMLLIFRTKNFTYLFVCCCCCCYNHINLCFLNYDGGFGYSLWQETLCKKKKKNRHLQSSKKTFIFLKIGLFCFFFCLQENGKVDWSKKNNIGLPKLHKIIKKKKRVDSYFFIIYKFCPERM